MSIYRSYTPDQVDNLLSNFLISSWSYSKLSQFARHEKAFEMRYIYNIKGKSSATTEAGNAYHKALQTYFEVHKTGETLDLPELERIAFDYIENIPANWWKCQKTTPTVEECRIEATKVVSKLLRNFFSEIGTYIDQIKEIIEVEVSCTEWLTINGVDIPLPCNMKIDLIFQSIDDKIVIADHKSKKTFSDQEELKLAIGTQAITYVNGYELKSGLNVDEVWFIENKFSTNKDGSKQLNNFRVIIDEDTRKLYELLLYEPLKRMLEAVQNPDYVYLINESDSYVDKSEIYEFWAKTMLAEIGEIEFNGSNRELIEKRKKKVRDSNSPAINPKVIKEFQKNAAEFIQYDLSNKDMTPGEKIEHVLRTFGVLTKTAHAFEGYSSNTFLLDISAGQKITSVFSHRLDIANALDVPNVRIPNDLVVINGRSYVAVEFAKKRDKDLMFDPSALQGMKIPLGRDNYDQTIVWNLDNQSTPHMLACGATGSGKSVHLVNIIEYAKLAGVKQIIILDPKYEFCKYENNGVEVHNEISAIEACMAQQVEQMNKRVKAGFNSKVLIVFDEFADALASSRKGNELKVYETVATGNFANGMTKTKREHVETEKSLEENLRILLQKGRSAGYRIVAATQRASVKVITGDAKVNFPVQICFRVPKEADSRVVLDEAGAETLAGMGDGLMKSPEYRNTVRFQAFYKA